VTKESKKKDRGKFGTARGKFAQKQERILGCKNDASAVISTKMLVKHSHFRDVCSVFRLI